MAHEFKFCPNCAAPLELIAALEDGGAKERLRCVACGYTHWNNPTPVLAAVIEYEGMILLARRHRLRTGRLAHVPRVRTEICRLVTAMSRKFLRGGIPCRSTNSM